MDEHFHSSPTPNHETPLETFDIADFGEPTAETMMAFFTQLEAIKQVADHKTIHIDAGSDEDAPQPTGDIDRFSLEPIQDEGYKGPYFAATMYDVPTELQASQPDFDTRIHIAYDSPDQEITYTLKYNEEPTLYIRKKDQASVDTEARELLDSVQTAETSNLGTDLAREVQAEQEAHTYGADKVTEGGMKQLVTAMSSALQARRDYLS